MKRLVIFLAISFVSVAAYPQIYQWKDGSGKTIISDKPPAGQARNQRKIESEASTITQEPTQTSNASPQKTTADRDLEFRKRQKESQENADKARKEQAAAAEQRENCTNARRNLQALESGERIALRDDKGERYFLDDAQREQEIAKARQAVQTNCK